MQVEEQPRNTPFPDGPQKAETSDKLLSWLCNRYRTTDLVNVDPMSCFHGHSAAPPRARSSVRVVPMVFEGSAAGLQTAVDNGFPVRMTLAEALGGPESRGAKGMRPHANPSLDKKQGTSPAQHNLDGVFINSVSLAEPLNTLSMPVAIVSSMLPPVYSEMREKQAQDLYRELKQEAPDADILAHIPASTDGKPDLRQIPVLTEVINAFHATEVCRTFGGILANDLWRGLYAFTPAEAIDLGFARPPVEHDFADPPPGMEKAYNTYVLVPMGHILSHVSNLPASKIRECDYLVERLKMPLTNELLPFLIMDLWTVHSYVKTTVESVLLNIQRNRVPLLEQWIEVVPLTHKKWTEACVAGEGLRIGAVSFKVIISYTTFPSTRRDGEQLLPMLSDGFPRLDIEYKTMIDGEDAKQSVAPRKKKALEKMQNSAPIADATPLTVIRAADAMDTGNGGGGGDDDDDDAEDT
jgi:hypothetical protein